MRPYVICHMITSLDGRLHPSGWSGSPDGGRSDWSAVYERLHDTLEGDAWVVGRTTMAEMSRAAPHPPVEVGAVDRRLHVAAPGAEGYAIAVDPAGKLHFDGGAIGGDAVIVLLGHDVPDRHLAELAADGVSYIVANTAELDLGDMLDVLGREFGIRRLLVEGGARTNGAFLAARLVDEVSVVLAPAFDGRPDVAAIVDAGAAGLAGQVQLSLQSCEPAGHGCLHLRYAVKSD